MGKKKHHQKKQDEEEEEEKQTKEQIEQKQQKKEEVEEKKFEAIVPKKMAYCPVCSLPFELCKYGKQVNACIKFLYNLAPAKVIKYHPTFKQEQVEEINKAIKQEQTGEEEKPAQETNSKSAKSIKDKYVVIDCQNRGRKNFITTVSGLHNFGVDTKDLAKKCSKKFAVSCSVIEEGSVQLQGDNLEAMREYLITDFKLKKKNIIDKEEFDQKYKEEVAKKKQEKKRANNIIKQQEVEEEKIEVVKDKNTLRMQMMQKIEQGEDDPDA